ncbi:MAG: hypothetical protein QM737_23755 [Ferruginibacter sp.]
MKKIVSICVLLLFCCIVKAQNNLQFNRVVIVRADTVSDCSGNCADSILVRTFTVDPGKVLKIESLNFIPGNYVMFIDRTPFSKASTSTFNTFPIWLPPGTYTIYFGTYFSTASQAGNYGYLMSAIEFNVVQ